MKISVSFMLVTEGIGLTPIHETTTVSNQHLQSISKRLVRTSDDLTDILAFTVFSAIIRLSSATSVLFNCFF